MKLGLPTGAFANRILRAALLVVVGAVAGASVGALFGGDDTDHGATPQAHAHDAPSENGVIWTCSMHPQIRQHAPGLCPICGMALIPLKKGSGDAPGPTTVVLSERAKILSRIRTTAVKRREGNGTDLRLLGRIETSETGVKNVTAWTGGRIDRLQVKVTGQTVRKGQVIATLYSPEVFAAHQDLIVARQQVERLSASIDSAKQAAERALEASRNRLRLLGVPDAEIDEMQRASRPTRQIAIRTPFGGTVMERVATEGAYVQTGALLYKIADLSRVWVQLDAYEGDLPGIFKGQQVTIHVDGIPEDTFEGEVDFIDPVIDPGRRIARVRVAVKNRERRLRPGMFVEAELKSANPQGAPAPLVIPASAPLFTGRRAVVFVETPDADRPTYKARTVRLGPKTGEVYPVVAGLEAGEKVVTRGAFTLDADLQIRGGDSMMAAPDDTQRPADHIISMTAKERRKLAPVMNAYLDMQTQLAADDFAKAQAAAKTLRKASQKVRIDGPTAATKLWKRLGVDLAANATKLKDAANIEGARGVFETVSHLVITLLERLGNPLDAPVRLTFCPMAMGSKGAYWVQRGEVVDNAYFGDAMRTCGEIKQTVAPGAYLMRNGDDTGAMPIAEGGRQ